jgi:hypothetical protein
LDNDNGGAIGGFSFSNENVDPSLEPDSGSFPEPEDTSFNIDEFERAASQSSGAASSSPSSPKTPKTRKKKETPAPAQKKIPPFRVPLGKDKWAVDLKSSYVSRDPIKYGATASIEIDGVRYESSFIGEGIDRKETKEGAILELKSKLKRLGIQTPKNFGKQTRQRKSINQYTFDNIIPKASQEDSPIEEYIPEGKGPLADYKPGDIFSPSSQSPTPSSSGSGSGTPPSQPPAPPGFPPDDYSDYPQGQYPEDPNDPNNKKPDIINQISDVPSDKQIKEDQAKNLASVKKQFKDFIREEKDRFAREFRDEKLALNREVQKLNAEAVARKTEINRASSDAKTAIYSLSAGVGLPGYIVASVADALVIQPAVREDVQAEQQYQRDLRDYKNESVDILNARKDAFREYTKSQEFSSLPDEVKAQYAETGEIPEGAIPSFEEWADKTGASAAFNKPLTAPSQPGTGKAEAITSMLGKAGPIATAVVEGINLVNNNTHRLGNEARDNISSSLSKQAIPALSDKAQSFSRMSDPLQLIGMESPAHAMFQEAVETFESAVKEFEGFAREDLGFSPGALEASVDGSIMRLEQSMRIAEQTDPQKEAMIRVTDEIGLIWNEFRALFFTAFAPVVVLALTVVKTVLQAILDVINFIKNLILRLLDIMVTIMEYLALIIPGLSIQAHVARQILNELKKSKAPPTGLKQILDDFHNPNNQPIKPPKPGNFR